MTRETWITVAIQIIGFAVVCIQLFFKSFTSKKGENLATKQDIGEITEIVESIKSSLSNKTEELKSELSYKNEHLIHLRASERTAIVSYYKANWALILNFMRTDLIKYSLDNFEDLKQIEEEISSLKYARDLSESELMFFYDQPELIDIIEKLNLSLLEFERILLNSTKSMSQLFKEASENIKNGINIDAKEMEVKRSEILANWHGDRRATFNMIRGLNSDLKKTLLNRLISLTS